MDPVAHTFTGAALAAAGLRRVTPLATAALLIGANIPDVDIVANFAGDFASLALRRGWTHGVLAIVIWPFALTAALLCWSRYRGHDPPHAGKLLGVAALAVLSHPTLDWLNNYGMRWLMPFDGRWFYGDALFIVDPWIWLSLGGVLCLRYSQRPASIAAWIVFWSASSALVFATGIPLGARLLWVAGLLCVLIARIKRYGSGLDNRKLDRAARIAVAGVAVYMAASLAANAPARARIERSVEVDDLGAIEDIMVAPVAADPLAAFVVVTTSDAYRFGDWHWFGDPQFVLREEPIEKHMHDPIVAAARRDAAAADFLTWSRYPYAVIESDASGHTVHLRDARYADINRLGGPSVRLDLDLNPAQD
jgi:inner membrane protein